MDSARATERTELYYHVVTFRICERIALSQVGQSTQQAIEARWRWYHSYCCLSAMCRQCMRKGSQADFSYEGVRAMSRSILFLTCVSRKASRFVIWRLLAASQGLLFELRADCAGLVL